MGLHARRSQEERGDSLSHIEIKFRNSVLKQITIKLIKKIVEQWIFGFCKWDPGFWGVYWDDERNGQMRSGQFFVTFVIHLQSKLELFILQQNAVLFLTARFFWQAILHLVAPCEIKIQLFSQISMAWPYRPLIYHITLLLLKLRGFTQSKNQPGEPADMVR